MIRARTPEVCVIGSGPAGALVAYSLAERGHDVVVLEAGKRFDPGESGRRMEQRLRRERWTALYEMGGERDAFTVSGASAYALNERRVKGVGGSTLHWGGTVPRMHPEDFEMDSRHGVADDWPIGYDELEPYYLQAEHELGAAGAPNPFGGSRSGPFPMEPHPLSYSDRLFQEAWEELGVTLHHLPRAINSASYDGRSRCQAFGTCSPVCPSGARYDATVHVRKAESDGVTVLDRAPVTRLEHDDTGERVTAAVYVHDDEERSVEADLFVVACGAVETPRLLLLSASEQHPDGLANASGLVGRRFIEHAAIRVRGRLDEPTRQHLIGFGTSQTQQFYGYDEGPRGSILITPLNTAGTSPTEAALQDGPAITSLLGGRRPDEMTWGDELVDQVTAETDGFLAVSAGTDLLPDPENRVSLDRSRTDDLGNPVPDLSFGIDEHAIGTLERAEELLTELVAATGAEAIETSHEPENAFFANHMLGTTRMGEDPATSVVDPDLRTHDIENLYVSGGSVFVTGGPANPTLTIAALALRLADHLDGRLS